MALIKKIKRYIKRKLGIESLQKQLDSLQKQINTLHKSEKKLKERNLFLEKELQKQSLSIENYNILMKSIENSLKKQLQNEKNQIMRKMYSYIDESKYPVALSDWYYERMGKQLNLENPKTYNEKIQWLKLYDSTPLKTKLADKYLVREYVKEKIGEEYLIPLLGVWDSFDEIDFDSLPNQFVLKANHGSSYNIIIKDKRSFNLKNIREKVENWMHTDFSFYNGFELHYKNIPRKIIAEKYMENGNSEIFDYRIFCFDGKPEFIRLDVDSTLSTHKANIYDTTWNRMNVTIANRPVFDGDHLKPKNLNKMLELAQILSEGFAHVRVDFYEIEGQIYFGEMTFTSTSGLTQWQPDIYDYIYGELIHLPKQIYN